MRRKGLVALASAVFCGGAGPVLADLKVCNQTLNFYNVAIGYGKESDPNFHTEGWWSLPANSCAVPVKKPLDIRFYYVYAMDIRGDDAITGETKACVLLGRLTNILTPLADIKDKTPNCWVRGLQTVNFREIDTGGAKDWTVFVNGGGG